MLMFYRKRNRIYSRIRSLSKNWTGTVTRTGRAFADINQTRSAKMKVIQVLGLVLAAVGSSSAFSTSRMLEQRHDDRRQHQRIAIVGLQQSESSSSATTTASEQMEGAPLPLISNDGAGTLAKAQTTSSSGGSTSTPTAPVAAVKNMQYNDFGGLIVTSIDSSLSFPSSCGMESAVGSEVGYFVARQKMNGIHCHAGDTSRN